MVPIRDRSPDQIELAEHVMTCFHIASVMEAFLPRDSRLGLDGLWNTSVSSISEGANEAGDIRAALSRSTRGRRIVRAQDKLKDGALGFVRGNPNAAVMCLDNRAANR
jgi:hypothetical protein